MSEFNTTVGFEELLNEEEEVFSTGPVKLKTGAGGNVIPKLERKVSQNPHAWRWLFNPFEVIDLRNEGASCGMLYLENLVFNRVKTVPINIGKINSYNLPDEKHSENNYDQFARTAEMIASELCGKHGDKGVIDISDLMGMEDERPAMLNTMLFGDEVECAFDVDYPEYPVPILPNLLEALDANMRTAIANQPEARNMIISVATKVRRSIALAARYARLRIDDAQKRLLDEKNPNRTLAAAEKRCYLALGEEIPNQMPLLTRGQQQTGGNLSADQIGAAVAAGVQAVFAQQGTAPVAEAPKPKGTPIIPVTMKNSEGFNAVVFDNPDASLTETGKAYVEKHDKAPITTGFEVSDADVVEAETQKTFAMHQQVKVGELTGKVIGKEGGNLRIEFEDGNVGKFKKDQFDQIEAL